MNLSTSICKFFIDIVTIVKRRMTGKKVLSDPLANAILLDAVDFKLVMARYYLQKIDSISHLNYDRNHFVLESNTESFLFFANLAIEVITFQITTALSFENPKEFLVQVIKNNKDNKELNSISEIIEGGRPKLHDPRMTIYDLRDKLDPTDSKQKALCQIIEKYFQYPKNKGTEWDMACTSLWQLRELRNHIAHFQFLNRSVGEQTVFIFRFPLKEKRTVKNEKGDNVELPQKIALLEDNPQRYFGNLFNELMKFVSEIREIVPYEHQSLYHKNQINFEL